jgi:hypothetical protein
MEQTQPEALKNKALSSQGPASTNQIDDKTVEVDAHTKAYLDFLYNEHKQPPCSCSSKIPKDSPSAMITDELAAWLEEFKKST